MHSCKTNFALQKFMFLCDLKMHVLHVKGKPFELTFITPFSWSVCKLLVWVCGFFSLLSFLNHSRLLYILDCWTCLVNSYSQEMDIFFALFLAGVAEDPAGNRCAYCITASLEMENLGFVEVHCITLFL